MIRRDLVHSVPRTAAILLVLSTGILGKPSTHTALKDGSSLTYELHHPLHHVVGTTHDMACTVEMDDATHVITKAEFAAEVASFDSGNSNRDSHALEVLDALSFPTVSFESTSISSRENELDVRGDLTFHGRTKPVSFTATEEVFKGKITVHGETRVSLTEFAVERPSLLMIPVADTLKITFSVTFSVAQ